MQTGPIGTEIIEFIDKVIYNKFYIFKNVPREMTDPIRKYEHDTKMTQMMPNSVWLSG